MAALDPPVAAAAALQALVSSSLVQVQTDDHDGLRTYRVLDTVRTLATGHQDQVDQRALDRAHARWVATGCCHTARRGRGRGPPAVAAP